MKHRRHLPRILPLIFCFLALGSPGQRFAAAADQIKIERVLGPEIKTGAYKHPACFDELRNGFLSVFFSRGKEKNTDPPAEFLGSRQKKGTAGWSPREP